MEAHPIAHCLSVSVHDRFSVNGITIVSREFIQQFTHTYEIKKSAKQSSTAPICRTFRQGTATGPVFLFCLPVVADQYIQHV
jgi:hypothetical protein